MNDQLLFTFIKNKCEIAIKNGHYGLVVRLCKLGLYSLSDSSQLTILFAIFGQVFEKLGNKVECRKHYVSCFLLLLTSTTTPNLKLFESIFKKLFSLPIRHVDILHGMDNSVLRYTTVKVDIWSCQENLNHLLCENYKLDGPSSSSTLRRVREPWFPSDVMINNICLKYMDFESLHAFYCTDKNTNTILSNKISAAQLYSHFLPSITRLDTTASAINHIYSFIRSTRVVLHELEKVDQQFDNIKRIMVDLQTVSTLSSWKENEEYVDSQLEVKQTFLVMSDKSEKENNVTSGKYMDEIKHCFAVYKSYLSPFSSFSRENSKRYKFTSPIAPLGKIHHLSFTIQGIDLSDDCYDTPMDETDIARIKKIYKNSSSDSKFYILENDKTPIQNLLFLGYITSGTLLLDTTNGKILELLEESWVYGNGSPHVYSLTIVANSFSEVLKNAYFVLYRSYFESVIEDLVRMKY